MPKMSELDLALQELYSAAQAITKAADSLRDFYSKTGADTQTKAEATPESPKPKALKLEDVRLVLAELSRSGKTEAVRKLLEKFGANKLSAVDPSQYEALLVEAEAITNG